MTQKQPSGGIKPSDFKGKAKHPPLINKIPSQSNDGIPDDEKLRLIDQTGLMQKVKKREAELMVKKQASTAEYIWQAIFLSIPFGFLMATFDVTVKVQYTEPWDYAGIVVKCVKSAPGKWYTTMRKHVYTYISILFYSPSTVHLFNQSIQIQQICSNSDGYRLDTGRVVFNVYLAPFSFAWTNDESTWISYCMDLFYCSTRSFACYFHLGFGGALLVFWSSCLMDLHQIKLAFLFFHQD
jgi:hypothetical protein